MPRFLTFNPPEKVITEVVNSQLTYVGYSRELNAGLSGAVWKLKRIVKQGNQTTEEYAAQGYYNQVWNDRVSAFPPVVLTNNFSLLFDGSNDYINLGNNYTFGPAVAFSWSFWFKAQNVAAQRAFIAKTTQDANVYGYSFQHTAAGKLFAQIRASGTLRQHTFNTTLSAGQWYHICFTYAGGSDMSGLIAYIDGTLEGTATSGSLASWTVTDPLTFGSRGTGFNYSGNLNQVSLWNRVLTPAEITELYNAGSPADLAAHSAYNNLTSWWGLNDDSTFPAAADLNDIIDGTLTNMTSAAYVADVP